MLDLSEVMRGDIVRNVGSGNSYVVEQITTIEGKPVIVAVRTITLTNGDEWEKSTSLTREED